MATVIDVTTDIVTVPTSNINVTEYKELVKDLLDELVAGDTSPFKAAQDAVDSYLDSADIDNTTKATMYSDFMMKAYTQINQQAMSSAMDLLRVNEELALKRYETEADINVKIQTKVKIAEDANKVAKDAAVSSNNGDLIAAKVISEQAAHIEAKAKMIKQYGYDKVLIKGIYDEGTGATAVTTALGVPTIGFFGAIDKQLVGYDKVNYKDALKTINEQIAMTTNAGVAPAPWQMNASKILVEMITDGKLDITGYTDVYTQADADALTIPDGFVVGDIKIDPITGGTTVAYVPANTEANGLG